MQGTELVQKILQLKTVENGNEDSIYVLKCPSCGDMVDPVKYNQVRVYVWRHNKSMVDNHENNDLSKWTIAKASKNMEGALIPPTLHANKRKKFFHLFEKGRKDGSVPKLGSGAPPIFKSIGWFQGEKNSEDHFERLRKWLKTPLQERIANELKQSVHDITDTIIETVNVIDQRKVGWSPLRSKQSLDRYADTLVSFVKYAEGVKNDIAPTSSYEWSGEVAMDLIAQLLVDHSKSASISIDEYLSAISVPQFSKGPWRFSAVTHGAAHLRYLGRCAILLDKTASPTTKRLISKESHHDKESQSTSMDAMNYIVTAISNHMEKKSDAAFMDGGRIIVGDVVVKVVDMIAMSSNLVKELHSHLVKYCFSHEFTFKAHGEFGVCCDQGMPIIELLFFRYEEEEAERRQFLNEVDEMNSLVLLIMYLTGGGTPRATDLLNCSLTHAFGSDRSVDVFQGLFMYRTNNETKNNATAYFKFLPRRISALVMFFFGVIRPAACTLLKLELAVAECTQLEEAYRFVGVQNGMKMTPQYLREYFRRRTTQFLAPHGRQHIGIQFLRQSVTAVQHFMAASLQGSCVVNYSQLRGPLAATAFKDALSLNESAAFLVGEGSGHSRQTSAKNYFTCFPGESKGISFQRARYAAGVYHEFMYMYATDDSKHWYLNREDLKYYGIFPDDIDTVELASVQQIDVNALQCDSAKTVGSMMQALALEDVLKLLPIKTFRQQQRRIINEVLNNRRLDVSLVAPTAFGKTIIFQAVALASKGVSIVVGPLVGVKEEQFSVLKPVAKRHVGTLHTVDVELMLRGNTDLKLLYMSASDMTSSKGRFIITQLDSRQLLSYVIVDECDCIAEWTFRKDLRTLSHLIRNLNAKTFLLSASMSPNEETTLCSYFGVESGHLSFRIPISISSNRLSFRVHFLSHSNAMDRVHAMMKTPMRTIIFCTSKTTVEEMFGSIQTSCPSSCPVKTFSGALQNDDTNVTKFIDGSSSVLITTDENNRGMNFPNVERIIIFNLSGSIPNLLQRAGRAGRSGEHAVVEILVLQGWKEQLNRWQNEAGMGLTSMRISDCLRIFKDIQAKNGMVCKKKIFYSVLSSTPISVCRPDEALCDFCSTTAKKPQPKTPLLVMSEAMSLVNANRCLFCWKDQHRQALSCPIFPDQICYKCGGTDHMRPQCNITLKIPQGLCFLCGFDADFAHPQDDSTEGSSAFMQCPKYFHHQLKNFIIACYQVNALRKEVERMEGKQMPTLETMWISAWKDISHEFDRKCPAVYVWITNLVKKEYGIRHIVKGTLVAQKKR